jgi:hypothetical protein
MDNISKLIAEKTGYTNLITELNEKLSGSVLNTLLLELFRKRAKKITPIELLKYFEKNRFVAPPTVDTIDFKEFEIRCLKIALGGTEVVSDATNVFALLIAREFKKKKNNSVIKYAATHRHVR